MARAWEATKAGPRLLNWILTGAAHPGENQIMILVQALSTAANFDRMTYFAYFNLAGLWRPLEVFAVEPAHVSRLALATTFDPAYKDALLSVDVDVANEQSKALPEAGLKLRLFDPRGKEVALRGLSTNASLPPWETRTIQAPGQSRRARAVECRETEALHAGGGVDRATEPRPQSSGNGLASARLRSKDGCSRSTANRSSSGAFPGSTPIP